MLVCVLVCPYGTVCVGVCTAALDKADQLLLLSFHFHCGMRMGVIYMYM